MAKAYAGAAGAAGNSAATHKPQRLMQMQSLPSSGVYGVPLLCWLPGGVLLEQLLPRLLECLQRAAVVLVAWRGAVQASPAATARVSTVCCCCADRELLPGRLEQLARADPAANC